MFYERHGPCESFGLCVKSKSDILETHRRDCESILGWSNAGLRAEREQYPPRRTRAVLYAALCSYSKKSRGFQNVKRGVFSRCFFSIVRIDIENLRVPKRSSLGDDHRGCSGTPQGTRFSSPLELSIRLESRAETSRRTNHAQDSQDPETGRVRSVLHFPALLPGGRLDRAQVPRDEDQQGRLSLRVLVTGFRRCGPQAQGANF